MAKKKQQQQSKKKYLMIFTNIILALSISDIFFFDIIYLTKVVCLHCLDVVGF